MNERIIELMLEAGKTIPGDKHIDADFCAKFAELIVQECIEVGGPEDSYRDEWFNAKVDSVAKIKQHFGVES
jgi:hypothetical protein